MLNAVEIYNKETVSALNCLQSKAMILSLVIKQLWGLILKTFTPGISSVDLESVFHYADYVQIWLL